ncbi:MAG: FecR domain-containing protein [Candidatus Omnitrophica bacterium]|nr:FecR domain-containing protein [Candidatus Omnitrophota bacterium]
MKILKLACIAILAISLATFSFAIEKRVGKIVTLKGAAEVKTPDKDAWSSAKVGMVLNEGDIIKTKGGAKAILNLNGMGQTATVEVGENAQLMLSRLVVDKKTGTEKTLLDLAMGEILIKAQKVHTPESQFEVKTPTSVVGVRGTKFAVKVEAVE